MSAWERMGNKADVDRALYSKQNRDRILAKAKLPDPIGKPFKDALEDRYAGQPEQMLLPNSPLLGIMLADKFGIKASGKKDRLSRLREIMGAVRAMTDDEQVDITYPAPTRKNALGAYNLQSKQIKLFPKEDEPLEQTIETLAHELEHKADDEGKRSSWVIATGRRGKKANHHAKYVDFEVDRPMSELARAAAIAGEDVHPSYHGYEGVVDALERRPQGWSFWDKLKALGE